MDRIVLAKALWHEGTISYDDYLDVLAGEPGPLTESIFRAVEGVENGTYNYKPDGE